MSAGERQLPDSSYNDSTLITKYRDFEQAYWLDDGA